MRIISGLYKSIVIKAPDNLPVRPTTDRAKESLFNIIEVRLDIEDMNVLDLFSGTGNIAYEFCSRGAKSVTAVDKHPGCINFIKQTKSKLHLNQLSVVKSDCFDYLKTCKDNYHIIFADAPYALEKIVELPSLVFQNNLLTKEGWLIIEHATHLDLTNQNGYFDKRVYGQSAFTFFKNPEQSQL